MEGDDQQDPIVDAVRSLLDGHVVLSRPMAAAGRYPPVEVLDSLSRLMPAVTTREQRTDAASVRRLLMAYAKGEDLVRIGAYKPGTDPELDRAIEAMPSLRRYMEQASDEVASLETSVSGLRALDL